MSTPEDRYGHLRPVPPVSGSEALEPEPEQQGTPGLTPPRTRGHSGRFITDVVVELGYLSRERVEQAIAEARVAGRSPEALMVEQGVLSSDQLSRAVAERYGLDHVDLNTFHVDMGAANLVSVQTARRDHAVPVGYVDPDTLLVAMSDPANVLAVDDMQMSTGLTCRVAVAAEVDIEALISRLNSLESAVSEAVLEDEEEMNLSSADVTELRESADDAPVVKLVNSIVAQAVERGASDIHFEPDGRELRVRFRIDGVLAVSTTIPQRMVAGVISRTKIMAELDIAEKRVPQDGRVGLNVDGRHIDVRVVTLPSVHGESIVMRILDKEHVKLDLDRLGFPEEERQRFERAFSQAYGAVLVTGPTGSGKSTTLYAAVQLINTPDKNVITIEDPVEYQLQGITQVQVNPKAGLDFATGLRATLRSDPDVILVGEIRDEETAQIAIEAAMTGHLVLSTLHTNDAASTITRLIEMGVEPFLVASAVDSIVAQRLCRVLCISCKRPTTIPGEVLHEHGFLAAADMEGYEPVGCARCAGTGYKSRVGLYEVLNVTEGIRSLALRRATPGEIAMFASAEGMTTLREDGLEKVRAGVTSIDEVIRVTGTV